jgi:hypothetical protein
MTPICRMSTWRTHARTDTVISCPLPDASCDRARARIARRCRVRHGLNACVPKTPSKIDCEETGGGRGTVSTRRATGVARRRVQAPNWYLPRPHGASVAQATSAGPLSALRAPVSGRKGPREGTGSAAQADSRNPLIPPDPATRCAPWHDSGERGRVAPRWASRRDGSDARTETHDGRCDRRISRGAEWARR